MRASSVSAAMSYVSVIVPVYNGAATLGRCLESIRSSSYGDWELIVVDDGSTDDSVEIAGRCGARVLTTAGRCGPGAARNLGAARARGEILLFVDADCSVHPNTIAEEVAIMQAEAGLDALFGSYDDAPSAAGAVARYKNLQHHHVHQSGADDARTFWAGCGAIRKSTFEALGGFDVRRFPRPSIEDIELGYRLTDGGGRIRLAKQVQVKHHKAWSLLGVLRSDLVDRGVPWTRLLLERRGPQQDLNLGWRGRFSVLLSVLAPVALLSAPFWAPALGVFAASVGTVMVLNRDFYSLLLRRGGLRLLAVGVALHWLYHLNCAVAYVIGHAWHWLEGSRMQGRAD